jgi:hypothetical protein
MKHITIIAVVDVEGAIRNGLAGNITLTDNGHSIGLGTNELITGCPLDSKITWVVRPKHPVIGPIVTIDSISSNQNGGFFPAVPEIISPKPVAPSEFTGDIDKRAVEGMLYQYTMILLVEGKRMSWDPFITIVKPNF